MEKRFIIRVTALSWIQWIAVSFITMSLVLALIQNYIPFMFHRLPLELLGFLILWVTYRYLYQFTLKTIEIGIERGNIYFSRKNEKYFVSALEDVHYIRMIYDSANTLSRVIIAFDHRKISFYRPFVLKGREKGYDQLDDVCQYIIGLDFLRQKSVEGWLFGIGKKRNNRMVREYWNTRYR